jgi:hypothetical protein
VDKDVVNRTVKTQEDRIGSMIINRENKYIRKY